MKTSKIVIAAALAAISFAAKANVYTYTGNAFDFDTIGTTPIIATFEFDFANSSMASYDWYEFKSWDVRSGYIHLSSANGDSQMNRFSFDGSGNITGWFFNVGKQSGDYADGNIQSLSDNYLFFAPNVAHDIVLIGNPVQSASIYGNQGTWTHTSDVPEPMSISLLAVGGMAWIAARRRDKRKAA
jgi:hypothetical protein